MLGIGTASTQRKLVMLSANVIYNNLIFNFSTFPCSITPNMGPSKNGGSNPMNFQFLLGGTYIDLPTLDTQKVGTLLEEILATSLAPHYPWCLSL